MKQDEPRTLPPDMLVEVQIKVLRTFVLDDCEGTAGETLTLPRHRAEYAKFLGLVEWTPQ